MKAIITGANGQDGFYLTKLLHFYNVEVIPIASDSGIDLSQRFVVQDLVDSAQPDFIFHLAAKSTLDHAYAAANHEIIAQGSFNLLDAALKFAPNCRVFLAGSAYQFKNEGNPIKETDSWDTDSVYCAARGYSKLLADAYRARGLMTYFGYFFHHESPKRGADHISQRIAKAARNRTGIEIGDPSVIKEWTFSQDAMEAVWALVNQDAIFDANIGTGIGHSIAKFASFCYAVQGLHLEDYIKIPKNYIAPYRTLTCNPERIFSIGWTPRVNLQELSQRMVYPESHEH
jgi:GDPmannose 4,6-dehydratase